MTRTVKDKPGASAAAAAFNQGCDARIRGERQSANPYEHDDPLWAAWKQGWKDVATYWAVQALGPHRDLPEVQA